MRDEGWTWGDLMGELMVRGIDPEEVDVANVLDTPMPEIAARCIENDVPYRREEVTP